MAPQAQMPLQKDIDVNWERSVAIQSAEYGLGRLCCSYDMLHAFTLIVVGMGFLPRYICDILIPCLRWRSPYQLV